jgi:hypothetical protein
MPTTRQSIIIDQMMVTSRTGDCVDDAEDEDWVGDGEGKL